MIATMLWMGPMNRYEREALSVFRPHLGDWAEPRGQLERLDDRVIGWAAFRPWLSLASIGVIEVGFGAVLVGSLPVVGLIMLGLGVLVLLAARPIGDFAWRRVQLPRLRLLAQADPLHAPALPMGWAAAQRAAYLHLRRVAEREGVR